MEKKKDFLARKQANRQLWWISDDQFELLRDDQKEQLLEPFRSVALPDVGAVSDILNKASQIAFGMAALARKGLEADKKVDPSVIKDIESNLKLIVNFMKAYGIME